MNAKHMLFVAVLAISAGLSGMDTPDNNSQDIAADYSTQTDWVTTTPSGN